MPNIALKWNPTAFVADMSLSGSDLKTGDDLASAIIISLFTWARAKPDDILPDNQSDLYGWWGDSYSSIEGDQIGSRLWLYRRKKITPSVIVGLNEVCEEALQHLIDDNVAQSIDVNIVRLGLDMAGGTITTTAHDGSVQTLQFSDIWRHLNA